MSSSSAGNAAGSVGRDRTALFDSRRARRAEHRLGVREILVRELVVGERVLRIAARARRLGDERAAVGERDARRAPSARRESGAKIRHLRSGSSFAAARTTRASASFGALTSAGPMSPNTSAAATGNGRLYCASSVVVAIAHADPRAIASRKLSIDSAAMSSAAKPCARCNASAASTAGCAQRHTGYALKYCSRMRQRVPRSSQKARTSSRSTVSAGAPVNPSRASSAAVTPTCAPQPEPSFTIVGESHARRICPRGPKYSATPSACRDPRGVEAQQPRGDRRAAERVPRAGAVVVGDARVERDPGAGRDFVAEHETRQEFAAVGRCGRLAGLGAVDHCQQRRQDRRRPRVPW